MQLLTLKFIYVKNQEKSVSIQLCPTNGSRSNSYSKSTVGDTGKREVPPFSGKLLAEKRLGVVQVTNSPVGEGKITTTAGKQERLCRMDSLWWVLEESSQHESLLRKHKGYLLVCSRGTTLGACNASVGSNKRQARRWCLRSFNSKAGEQNLENSLLALAQQQLLLLLCLNMCVTGRPKDDCSWRPKVPSCHSQWILLLQNLAVGRELGK